MEKINKGDCFELDTRFTQAQVNAFADCSLDNNPIHVNEEYAAKTPFGRPIVHGFLAASVFSRVFGTKWPGEGTIYMSQQMSFRAPVFVEHDYVARFEVLEVDTLKHRGIIKCSLVDKANDKEVITGEAKLMHTERF